MSAQTKQAPPIDFEAIQLLRAHYDEARGMNWVALLYPGTTGGYEIQGLANGEHGTCECHGFRRWGHCKHVAAIPEFVAALERQRVGKLPTDELTDSLAWYRRQDSLTHDERVAMGAIRAVLVKRGVRLPADAAMVARGRAAVSSLFDEA